MLKCRKKRKSSIKQHILKGNIFGLIAILLWSTLASFSVLAKRIPPLELTAMAFFIAFLIGLILWKKEKKGIVIHLKFPLRVWLIGVGGLFGYHFFYFLALQHAPAAEANLINYLWPLLIVLFSSFLPNEHLRWFHVIGALLGLSGVVILVSGGVGFHFQAAYFQGYLYALSCAMIWASYSVLSRYFAHVPTSAVGGFCGVTAVLALIFHFIFETTVIPNITEILAAVMLGLGPVGGAFFVWDYGLKHGDIKLLGSSAYAIPLLSTLLLLIFGLSSVSYSLWIACALIILGSLISSLNHFKKRKSTQS
ncbi:aromatic amino acid exporter YddG [Sulfurospirillum sp. 1612]|uniref:aromatic amino acid exporter YddG n=1 Tax=Sulfurospirillum sp. 1612 TaxID=3094835 RepID=UPI002F9367FF